MKNLIMHRKGEDSVVTWIKKRIRLNLNFLSLTTGEPGNGKSYFDLSIAEMIDPDFNPEKQIVFTPLEFMQAINGFNGKDEELAKKEYKVLMVEELQKSAGRRKWQSKINEQINIIVSTFRNQHIIVLFNSPYSSLIDSNTVKMLHAKIETRGWRKKDGKSAARFKILQYNDKLSKMYEHSLYIIKDGNVSKMDGLWIVNKPSKRVTEVYERKKTEFTDRTNREATTEFAKMEKGLQEKVGIEMEPNQQEIYITYHTKTPLQLEISKILGKNQSTISETMKYMDKIYPGWRKYGNLLGKQLNMGLSPYIAPTST